MKRKYDLSLQRPTPGMLERAGVWYFRKLSSKGQEKDYEHSSDDELRSHLRKMTFWAAFWAFQAGAVTTLVAIYFQNIYAEESFTMRMIVLAWSTIPTTAIEFILLFYITVRYVYQAAAHIGNGSELDKPVLLDRDSLPSLLSRAALEIPDPVYEFIGIDPTRLVARNRILVVGILYKIKVMATNALAKIILMRFIGNSVMRVSVSYVAVIFTGLWNSIVILRVARETRLRLVGNLLANYLATDILTEERINGMSMTARIGCIRAVANAVVLTQNYHPNMLILLVKLCEILQIQNAADYDDWDKFLDTLNVVTPREREFLLDLLAVSAAFDGRLSKLERAYLPQAFGNQSDYYIKRVKKLTGHILRGELNAARAHCFQDFTTDVTL